MYVQESIRETTLFYLARDDLIMNCQRCKGFQKCHCNNCVKEGHGLCGVCAGDLSREKRMQYSMKDAVPEAAYVDPLANPPGED